ncbi:hypothetical protein LWI29_031770 [Acer saccharum]|uniref:Uncharacterized protein n=1 Tax=Acer saccharum TaxID=4024 RepID=A0AA39VQY4_ACESA|nr:hypothetical protein LWI29_031770 [Acer saccharum]
MKRLRGFKLRRKIVKVFKWIIRSRRIPTRHLLRYNPMSKLMSLARHLRRGAKQLCCPSSDPVYIQLGQTQTQQAVKIPKGHLAVYVGESDDDTKRVLVPVIYFNHPLFGELLKEAERVYGYNQPGGITIPCGYSEFEKVQMRIAAWNHCRMSRHRPHW